MKFTTVRLTAGSTVINLPLRGASPADPYILRGIDGLVSPGNDVFVNQTQEAGFYSGSRPLLLQPVVTIGLNPSWSTGQDVSDLRTTLYILLTQEDSPVILSLLNGATEICRVSGYISKFDTAPFSKDPAVQMTLSTTARYLVAPTAQNLTPGSGLPATGVQAYMTNPGSARSGFIMDFTLNAAAASGFALQNIGGTISDPTAIQSGDRIVVNTIPGQRDVTRTRAGVTVSLIPTVNLNPDWRKMTPGANSFMVVAGNGSAIAFQWNSLVYTPAFAGI